MKRISAMPWTLIVFLAICRPLLAIDPDRRLDQLYHMTWTAKNGAPTYASAWTETPNGFLWFGSASGLFRFDGVTFERYDVLSGVTMPKTAVSALTTLADGSLLIGWGLGGVSRLKDGEFRDYGGKGSGYPPNSLVDRFQKGGDGSVWALTYLGAFRLGEEGHWQRIGSELPIPLNSETLFYADRGGTLWLGTDKQTYFLRPGEEKFREIRGGGRTMTQSPDGSLWLQSSKSIRRIDQDGIGAEILTAPSGEPLGQLIFADSKGSIWSGGNDKGISRIAHPGIPSPGQQITVEKFTAQDGLTHDGIAQIFQDREGNMWITTGKGIDSFRQSNVVPVKFPPSVGYAFLGGTAESVRVIAYFPGVVFTIRNGSVADTRPWGFKTMYVYHGKNNVTWLGTETRGLIKVVRDHGQPVDTPGVSVGTITEDEKGRLWANIRGKELLALEDGRWTSAEKLGGPKLHAFSSFTDSKGRAWFGLLDNSVAMIEHDKVKTFGVKDGVQVGTCLDIGELDGKIFIGGERALEVFDGRNFVPIVPNDRDTFKDVRALTASSRSGLWFSDTRGLVHIPISEIRQLENGPRRRLSYELFDIHDGLASGPQRRCCLPSSFGSADGRIWFATEGDVAWIDPEHLVHNTIAPGVAVDSVTANGKAYHFFSPLTLAAGTTSLRIAFTAASMTIPERVRFRFKLDGVDKDWQDAGARRETTYTNLGPGSYRFHVIACNNDGVWNEAGAVSNFTIAPTFYQTSWFRALCVLIACLLAAAAYRFRVRQIATAINIRFNERLMERARIARDLHDTLLQSFQGLMLNLQVVDDSLPPGKTKERLQKSLERADRAIAEGRSAVENLRTTTVEVGLAEALKVAAEEMLDDPGPTFSLIAEGSPRDLKPILRDEVYRIACEGLRNAFRHSHARHIEVEISYSDPLFRLRIRDDGEGMPAEILQTGRSGHYGLSGMRERAQQTGAKLDIWSSAGKGTEIDLSFPGSLAYVPTAQRSWLRLFRR